MAALAGDEGKGKGADVKVTHRKNTRQLIITRETRTIPPVFLYFAEIYKILHTLSSIYIYDIL